ncbi:hypothetical protein TNCV_639981 [Trichonephila clavipes]|nr:hypothetical protein TNCV_639981 [Trichonephila clavipes]
MILLRLSRERDEASYRDPKSNWITLSSVPVFDKYTLRLQAYGDETLSSAHVIEWYNRFSGGKVSVEDDEPAGRPRSAITDQNIAKIRDIRKKARTGDGWLLHQDNASAPMALSGKQFLTSKNITLMGHPPYSPDLAP